MNANNNKEISGLRAALLGEVIIAFSFKNSGPQMQISDEQIHDILVKWSEAIVGETKLSLSTEIRDIAEKAVYNHLTPQLANILDDIKNIAVQAYKDHEIDLSIPISEAVITLTENNDPLSIRLNEHFEKQSTEWIQNAIKVAAQASQAAQAAQAAQLKDVIVDEAVKCGLAKGVDYEMTPSDYATFTTEIAQKVISITHSDLKWDSKEKSAAEEQARIILYPFLNQLLDDVKEQAKIQSETMPSIDRATIKHNLLINKQPSTEKGFTAAIIALFEKLEQLFSKEKSSAKSFVDKINKIQNLDLTGHTR